MPELLLRPPFDVDAAATRDVYCCVVRSNKKQDTSSQTTTMQFPYRQQRFLDLKQSE